MSTMEVTSSQTRPNPSQPPIIAELAYDVVVGQWSYKHIRKDKAHPNAIEAVLGVFVEQAEDICVEELEFVLNSSGSSGGNGGDFDSQLVKMKRTLVEQQRAQLAAR